jgi:type IV pilus assembly protein PilV
MSGRNPKTDSQSGSVLLEGLFAILIFSMGVLAIIGLQTASVRQATSGQYRTDATLLANDLIGQMWIGDRAAAALQVNFNSPDGPAYVVWAAKVGATLPGVQTNAPTVAIGADSVVTVEISWKAPNAAPTEPVSKYTVVTQIM